MILEDYHVHTNLSDGNNSLEEMVRAAIDLGLRKIGFSDHIYTSFDLSYCLTKEKTREYIETLKVLKDKYKEKITIYTGIECDYYSDYPLDEFDYVIGSVHYVNKDGKYYSVDSKEEGFLKTVKEIYNGNYYEIAKDYYNNVADVLNKTNADIIGHFDLITKYNEDCKLFDMRNEEYLSYAKKAIDKLIPYNKPFEVNTGAISRGYRTTPYPDLPLLKYIKEKGGRVILTSDSHSVNTICNYFNEFENLIKETGFTDYIFKI